MSKQRPPPPFSIGRFHTSQINVLYFSSDNEKLYSGDSEGRVVCTLTRTFRPLVAWKPHRDGILTIQEWGEKIITHGRDNKLHVWAPVTSLPTLGDTAASSSAPPSPKLLYSLDVNALNFCRFSLLKLPPTMFRSGEEEAFVAVPNLVEAGLTDIWAIPSCDRIHAAIGKPQWKDRSDGPEVASSGGQEKTGSGIIMTQHLYTIPQDGKPKPQLRLLVGYEGGDVSLFVRTDAFLDRSIDGKTWDVLWNIKVHVESVMGMTVSPDGIYAYTVSADHLIGKIFLPDEFPDPKQTTLERLQVQRTKYPGNAAIIVRFDGRVCAVASWDGKVRLYSTKSFKSVGTLDYHNEAAYAVAFANPLSDAVRGDDEEDDDGWSVKDSKKRSQWLVSAGKEGRVAFWLLDAI